MKNWENPQLQYLNLHETHSARAVIVTFWCGDPNCSYRYSLEEVVYAGRDSCDCGRPNLYPDCSDCCNTPEPVGS